MANPQKERLRKVNELFTMIQKGSVGDNVVNEEKLIAYFSEIYGSERRKVLEYLKELELNGKIIRKDNHIFTIDSFEEKKVLSDIERGLKDNEEKSIKD